MIPEHWQRVCDLVDAALALEESRRASFVRHACDGDEALFQEVTSLLDEQENARKPRLV
jgi:hypothetical protein